jgi:DNA-binding SARP family transcriptional activator
VNEPEWVVCLLNGPFVLVDGDHRAVPEGSKRLLVLLAIRRSVSRRTAAELLWPTVEPRRAAGNLRSASWRLRCAGIQLIADEGGILKLDPRTQVDVDLLCRHAHRLATGSCTADDLEILPSAIEALDLLPGWYEDWVSLERDRVRTVMLEAIDAIAVQLRKSGRCAEAIDAALIAVRTDPLRDSSQSALITAHLGEGNLCEARQAFVSYRRFLRAELGLEPPECLARLLHAQATIPAGTRRLAVSGIEPRCSNIGQESAGIRAVMITE